RKAGGRIKRIANGVEIHSSVASACCGRYRRTNRAAQSIIPNQVEPCSALVCGPENPRFVVLPGLRDLGRTRFDEMQCVGEILAEVPTTVRIDNGYLVVPNSINMIFA